MVVDSKPEKIDELDRRIIQLKIEREALNKESDKGSAERLDDAGRGTCRPRRQIGRADRNLAVEKALLAGAQKVKEELESARTALERAQRDGDLAKAGELAYGIIPDLEKKLADAAEHDGGDTRMLDEEVTDGDIASVVSRWTGIPVDKMLEGEREKLLRMEQVLSGRVVGQDEAVVAVSNAVRRARAGLQDPNRPLGSFLFLGPPASARPSSPRRWRFLFDDETAMQRLDMSEYMEKHSVARLIGAPPGYVGYEEGGALTEGVRRRPYQVVLFDEVEKAHPDVFNALLQVLDDGRLTDGQGQTGRFSQYPDYPDGEPRRRGAGQPGRGRKRR